MAALNKDAAVFWFHNEPTKITVPAAGAATFYKGALVWADVSATGAIISGQAAGDKIIGICARQTVTTAAGDLVEIYTDGVFSFPALTGITLADLGDAIFMPTATKTDNPADCVGETDTAPVASDALVGYLVSFLDSRPVVKFYGNLIKGADATVIAWV